MADHTRLTSVQTVRDEGSWLFTVRDQYGELDEVLLVPCEDGEEADSAGNGVRAWVNRCTHEAQRLDRGFGAAIRDGEIVCPKHGSMFEACSGHCDNGEAADTTLVDVDVTVEDGHVFLGDRDYEFAHPGSVDDGETAGDPDSDEDGDDDSGVEDENGTGDRDLPSWARDDDDDDDVPSSTSHIGL